MADFRGTKGRDDTFFGTDGADTFRFDPSDLTSGDLIYGGDGNALDTLVFTARGVIESTALSAVIGIERIELSDAGNTITLVQSLLETAANGSLTVQGGAGADRINAAGIYDEPDVDGGTFALFGGAGDDVLIGGKDDRLVLDGQAGSDTILINRGTAVYDPLDQRITAMSDRAVLAIGTGLTLDLTRTGDQTDGDRAVVTGFWNADASRSTQAVTLIGRDGSELTGGRGADTINGGSIIRGGGGRDTIVGSATGDMHLFMVDEGDFVRGESITGRSGLDQLQVSGTVDFRAGTLVGMDVILVSTGTAARSVVSLYTSQFDSAQLYTGGQDGKTVAVNLYLDSRDPYTNSFFSGPVSIYGTDRADTLNVTGAVVYAGLGNDTVTLDWNRYGTLDGGKGVDTLSVIGGSRYQIDLSSTTNQFAGSNWVVSGFENLDLSKSDIVTVYGSNGSNQIIGSSNFDRLEGGGGNDVLRGGGGGDSLNGGAGNDVIDGGGGSWSGGADQLTGGSGRDTFVWTDIDEAWTATITDYTVREDRLAFSRDVFDVPGDKFDTRIVAGNGSDLTGADLVIAKSAFNDATEVAAFLNAAPGEPHDGMFVVAQTSGGHTILYYAADGVGVDAVVDLGSIKPTELTLADFSFI